MESDIAYFSRRAVEEKLAADAASYPVARQAHLELASRYEELASAMAANDVRLGLHLVYSASRGSG